MRAPRGSATSSNTTSTPGRRLGAEQRHGSEPDSAGRPAPALARRSVPVTWPPHRPTLPGPRPEATHLTGIGTLLRPVHGRLRPRPGQRVVDVARDADRACGRRGAAAERRAAQRRRRRLRPARRLAPCGIEGTRPERLHHPDAAVGRRAATDPEHSSVHPRRAAAAITVAEPLRLVAVTAARTPPGSRLSPHTSAISMTASSPRRAYDAATGSPVGPTPDSRTRSNPHRAARPRAARRRRRPPERYDVTLEVAAPDSAREVAATSAAVSVPLNLSGASRTSACRAPELSRGWRRRRWVRRHRTRPAPRTPSRCRSLFPWTRW